MSSPAAEAVDHRWIATAGELDELIDAVMACDRYALDTEFHRERTYFPRLALVQIAWRPASGGESASSNDGAAGQQIALIDPLEVDVTPLAKLFADGGPLCIIHAAQQDMDVLTHAVGAVPWKIFDTQIAGGFVGYGTPSLTALLSSEVGVSPPKGDRLTDWLQRPLTNAQRNYAAVDVLYLLEVHELLVAKLADLGRLEWVDDACEELRTRPTSGTDVDNAWMRLKDARSLKPKARAIAQSLARWREQRAMRVDIPVRQVLPDLAVLGISQRAPSTLKELSQARGVDERHRRGGIAEEILEAVAIGRDADPPKPPASSDELDRSLRPAITLVSAWVAQLARDEKIDTALLGTRADIVALLRGDADAALATGWRNEVVGDDIRRLIAGEAGLTFDGAGRLCLFPVDRPADDVPADAPAADAS